MYWVYMFIWMMVASLGYILQLSNHTHIILIHPYCFMLTFCTLSINFFISIQLHNIGLLYSTWNYHISFHIHSCPCWYSRWTILKHHRSFIPPIHMHTCTHIIIYSHIAWGGYSESTRGTAHERGEASKAGGDKGRSRLLPKAQDEEEGQGGSTGAGTRHEATGTDAHSHHKWGNAITAEKGIILTVWIILSLDKEVY